jgi:signal peptide peptidase SppA
MRTDQLFMFMQDSMWALSSEKTTEMTEAVRRVLSGDAPRLPAADGPAQPGTDMPYTVSNGIATVPVYGTIAKRANLVTRYSGGTSAELLASNIKKLANDPLISGIVLDVDSPGGAIDGTKALADVIFEVRGKKPIVAVCDGQMCSAAYWIASAADEILASETSLVGSIGVVLTHYDMSEKDKKVGVVKTDIYAGKYKRIAGENRPLDKEGKEYLQGMVDDVYAVFLANVARNRGASVEQVLEMAEGRVFVGSKAKDAGLVDRIGSLETAVSIITERRRTSMTMEELKAKLEAIESENQRLSTSLGETQDLLTAAIERSLDVEAEATMKVRKEQISRAVDILVAEGRLFPAHVESGLVDFVMAIDGTTFTIVGEGSDGAVHGQPAECAKWFLESFLPTLPVIFDGNTMTEEGQSALTPQEADVKLGLEIATGNVGFKLPGKSSK